MRQHDAGDLATAPAALPLLGPGDPPPYTVVNGGGTARALLLADHAGRAVPRALGQLGLDDPAVSHLKRDAPGPDDSGPGRVPLDRHIAYDIGIAWLTRRLAALLDAPALVHNYSRLLIDPNRPLDDPTSICVISDGVVVPANRGLTPDQRRLLELNRQSGERLSEMIRNLLEVSRFEAGAPRLEIEEVDLKELTVRVADRFEPACRKQGVRLRRSLPSGPVTVAADPERARELGLDGGVEVTRLYPGVIRRTTNMQPGFIITQIDGKRVTELEDLIEILEDRQGGVMLEGRYPRSDETYYYAFGM